MPENYTKELCTNDQSQSANCTQHAADPLISQVECVREGTKICPLTCTGNTQQMLGGNKYVLYFDYKLNVCLNSNSVCVCVCDKQH